MTLGITVETSYSPDRTLVVNHLLLSNLVVQDSGIWKCVVATSRFVPDTK